jgi:branched-subunit amino acid ABC-type transport system permease component
MEFYLNLIAAQAVAGLTRGMLYYLLASGLTLIFGVLGIINFAHGTFYMISVFLCISVAKATDYWVAVLVAPVIVALVGGLCEMFLLRRIYKAHHLLQILMTFALVYIGVDVVKAVWGTYPKSLPSVEWLQGGIFLGGVRIAYNSMFMVTGCGLLLWLILYRTKWGTVIRACTMDNEIAEALGLNVKVLFTFVFVLGIWLAGIAGVVAAPVIGGTAGMDMDIIVTCFAVIIVGGVGSLSGALLGALIIGLVESFGLLVFPQYAIVFGFAVMTIVLIFRPWGILGRAPTA